MFLASLSLYFVLDGSGLRNVLSGIIIGRAFEHFSDNHVARLHNEKKKIKLLQLFAGLFFLLTTGLSLICLAISIVIFQPYDYIFKWVSCMH